MKIKNYIARVIVACFILIFFQSGKLVVAGLIGEEEAVYEAARVYLDAEVKRDLRAVYGYLAPSSAYRAQNNYEAYLAEAQSSSVRIVEYKILRVHKVRVNHDRKAFPKVEKFAQVEVDLKVYFSDVKKAADMNYDFTFIKENGRWFKG